LFVSFGSPSRSCTSDPAEGTSCWVCYTGSLVIVVSGLIGVVLLWIILFGRTDWGFQRGKLRALYVSQTSGTRSLSTVPLSLRPKKGFVDGSCHVRFVLIGREMLSQSHIYCVTSTKRKLRLSSIGRHQDETTSQLMLTDRIQLTSWCLCTTSTPSILGGYSSRIKSM